MEKERPAVLNNVSETQIVELERQFAENDRTYWRDLTHSYGWSEQDSDAVWKWFSSQSIAQEKEPPRTSP